MPLFQPPPRTPEELARSRPLAIGPDRVMTMEEKEWYARVYRGEGVPQLTVRAVAMGSALGFFLAFTNLYIGLKTGWYLGVAITAVILSFSIWTTLQRLGLAGSEMSILENACMQSCASCAGYGTGSTIVTAIPFSWFVGGASVAGGAIIALTWGYFGIPPLLGALAVFLSFFLTLVSARATGETSVTPAGPMGKITQLTYGVLIPQNAVANLVTAGITASSASSCADLLNDLKVGYLLGANPRRQFVAQLFGVAVGTVATTLGYLILIPDATAITGVGGYLMPVASGVIAGESILGVIVAAANTLLR